MFARSLPVRRLALVLPAALALAACTDSTGPSGAGVAALSFAARGDVSATGSGARVSPLGTLVVSAGDTLRIASVRLVIDEVELYRGTSGTCGSSSGDDSNAIGFECAELESGPHLVDLPVNGALTSPIAVNIPAGTYRKLELKLRRADSGDDRSFNGRHPEMSGITVLVVGTYRGQSFTWRGDVEADLEMYFNPSMVVDGSTSFTVNIDVGGWFRSGTGAIIDPSAAGAGSAGFATVAQNIRASFGVYHDDDRDGYDDHGGRRRRD